MMNRLNGLLRPIIRARPNTNPFFYRGIHITRPVANNNVFGELTSKKQPELPVEPETTEQASSGSAEVDPAQDEELQKYHREEAAKRQLHVDKYITPLKRQLFNQVVQKHGFYKNDQVVVTEDGKTYKLSLTPIEIDLLEPSIYLSSYRIKSSMKKATQVNRFVRKLNVKNAINQLHFNPKKMSTELEILLKRGLEQARSLNLDEDTMYIDALWVGSDGDWRKRLDVKGRARHGVIEHPQVHLKVVLRSNQTKLRKDWEKQQKELYSKPRMFLNNEPLNFKVRPYYKW
ncbi:ribosomal protein L22/L17 [Scheffersomyces xylosifermentans]|uniref:ribosomal protein L22/L17 n=1 Tax=Scheffersomyces xylosifermentans TaxID=1304137 RepID=UPI00315D4154